MRTIGSHSDPQVKAKAIEMLKQNEKDLEDDALLALLDLFKTNVDKARTYTKLWRESLCKCWVEKELQRMSVHQEDSWFLGGRKFTCLFLYYLDCMS